MDPQSEALRFRLRMTRDVSFPHPFRHFRENGNPVFLSGSPIKLRMTGGTGSRIKCGMTKRNVDPQSEALRFRLRMTRDVSFPYFFCHSRENGNPVFLSGTPIKLGMTGGDGSPIRSALLSVEDDKGCVIPAQAGIQTVISGSPIRSALLSVEDDRRVK